MKYDQKHRRLFRQIACALLILLGTAAPVTAQQSATRTVEKWRPNNGTYAAPGSDFAMRCGEFGDLIVGLSEKSISGHEWSCKITGLADTAPGAIKLNLSCDDLNMPDSAGPNSQERSFKEVMLLERTGGKSVFVRKTINGKFKGPRWKADFCPEDAQRMHKEATALNKARIDQEAAEEQLRRNPWRPNDGVYATPGPNFDDRCLKSGDAIIDIAERSISNGTDKCSWTFVRDELTELRLFATCGQGTNTSDSIGKTTPSKSEVIVLRKTDDKTIFMQKSTNGNFVEPGGQLAYCGPDAQKKYAQQKDKK